MAQIEQILLIDDLDGTRAAETVSFALGQVQYEIDLNPRNAAQMRSKLRPFIAAGRPATCTTPRMQGQRGKSAPGTSPRRSGRASAGHKYNQAVRKWANENGIAVPDRGPIPEKVYAAYERERNKGSLIAILTAPGGQVSPR
ncbi:Lsr2 family protein [Streptomyces sp. NPDC056672]|uniref:histone-like nucleoid-structuring protein Lsr2 n=1 Tax=Streptomyces sp. NPDC056672 TaxID=3345906 RepID=UPI0036BC829E